MTIRVEPALTGLIDLLAARAHVFDLSRNEDQGDTGNEEDLRITAVRISG